MTEGRSIVTETHPLYAGLRKAADTLVAPWLQENLGLGTKGAKLIIETGPSYEYLRTYKRLRQDELSRRFPNGEPLEHSFTYQWLVSEDEENSEEDCPFDRTVVVFVTNDTISNCIASN